MKRTAAIMWPTLVVVLSTHAVATPTLAVVDSPRRSRRVERLDAQPFFCVEFVLDVPRGFSYKRC